jgi:signal transduction histidine kinase/ActR/RegA family two-component response regulator
MVPCSRRHHRPLTWPVLIGALLLWLFPIVPEPLSAADRHGGGYHAAVNPANALSFIGPASSSRVEGQPGLSKTHPPGLAVLGVLGGIAALVFYLLRLNRKLKQQISERNRTEEALRQSQLTVSANNRQLEQLALAAAAALAIKDLEVIGKTVSRAIAQHSDYQRVIISLFKDDYPFRDIIGFAGIDEEIIVRLRHVELPKSWYDRVFEHGIRFGQFSYYIPHTMKHILNQEATIYGDGEAPSGLNRWHPDDNLFVRMNDDQGNFIGVISVDNAKSGRRPSDETVRPLEIFSSLIAQLIVLRREQNRRTHLEEQLRHAQKMEAIGNLTGGIAHDFNNILGVIIGHTELALLNQTCSDNCRRHFEEITAAAIRARDIVRQLLSFNRTSLPQAMPIILQPIVEDALTILRSTIPATVDIRCDFAAEDAIIFADATQMYQVVINLCTNSAQAMADGGVLNVTVDHVAAAETMVGADRHPSSGLFVRLVVDDTGSGIAQEVLPHIFDPYFTTKDVGKGTGIGLAVVQGIVASHNGHLFVSSEVKVGTRFTILLPAFDQGQPEPIGNEESLVQASGSGRILFVDDEPSLPAVAKQILERFGYQVETCTDSVRALTSCQQQPGYYDLIITDFTMPGMTGDVLAGKLLADSPDLPIILCSGFTERIDEHQARAIGIRAFLKKPMAMRTLLDTVREVLGDTRQPPESDHGSS